VLTIAYSTTVSFAKLSILVFYLRLSPQRGFRLAVYTLIGIVSAYTISYVFVLIFMCNPPHSQWDLTANGTCLDKTGPFMTFSVANIMIDLAILIIPMHVVIPLQMPKKQKVSLLFIFATGGL
jgi:hypothetical protein